MAIEFKLPPLGEGVASADIANILVKEGDELQAEQNMLELETDKAVVELPSPQAGKLVKLHVKSGDTVKPGDLIATFEGVGNGAAEKPAEKKSPDKPAAPAAKAAPAAPAPQETAKPAASSIGKSGPVTFKMPQIADGVTKADVATVLVSEGDTLTAGQNVLEVETDKAVVEVPCPHAGKVTKIFVKAGDTLQVGSEILVVETSGSAEAAEEPAAKSPAPAAKKEEAAPAKAAAPAPQKASAPAAKSAPAAEPATNGAPVPAGPATRRMARELGVDLRRVTGTGPGGRILAEDVQSFVKQIMTGGGSNMVSQAGETTALSLPELPDFSQWGNIEKVAMSKIAKVTAANLSLAWQVIPHVTQHELADVTELEAGRKRHTDKAKGAAKITMTVLAIKAVVAALKQFPYFNASIDTRSNEIIHKQYYHIGVAVDTEYGLVVPVIKDANLKSVLEIARELEGLAQKARDRKLAMADFQGGTFTITNLGGIGGTTFTPIVNYPEVAILGMSRAKQQPVVIDGELETRLMLPLSLSYDHRVINGADAARFIVKVAGLLADPSQLVIES